MAQLKRIWKTCLRTVHPLKIQPFLSTVEWFTDRGSTTHAPSHCSLLNSEGHGPAIYWLGRVETKTLGFSCINFEITCYCSRLVALLQICPFLHLSGSTNFQPENYWPSKHSDGLFGGKIFQDKVTVNKWTRVKLQYITIFFSWQPLSRLALFTVLHLEGDLITILPVCLQSGSV